jgi:hypothetical protein
MRPRRARLAIGMRRTIITAVALLMSPIAGAYDEQWYLWGTDSGCQPIDILYSSQPLLRGLKTPTALFKVIRNRWPDTTMRPYVDVVSKSVANDPFDHLFNRSNAFVIDGKPGGFEGRLTLFTGKVCNGVLAELTREHWDAPKPPN